MTADPDIAEILPPRVQTDCIHAAGRTIPKYTGEFWTSGQRRGSSIHEISYRACFKPQLPGFFIEHFSSGGDLVYDPFGGRGTTVIEAGLNGRRVAQNDINPLSTLITRPRFFIPDPGDVQQCVDSIPTHTEDSWAGDLSMFYHPRTEQEILSLRDYLHAHEKDEGTVLPWIRMVATNRLTGHSSGFFSVYTLPPNQAVSAGAQVKINQKRNQVPPYRDTHAIIVKKTRSLLRNVTGEQRDRLRIAGVNGLFLSRDAGSTPEIGDSTVQLTVTSPPFLNVVQYSKDNWLRCWFNRIDDKKTGRQITVTPSLAVWSSMIRGVFKELYRITRPGGYVAFEVGEVQKGAVNLEEHVIPAGLATGFECTGILVNSQAFTKTSNIWGIDNNRSGTNTNRIVLFQKMPRA